MERQPRNPARLFPGGNGLFVTRGHGQRAMVLQWGVLVGVVCCADPLPGVSLLMACLTSCCHVIGMMWGVVFAADLIDSVLETRPRECR